MCVNRKLQYSLVYLVWAEMHVINKQTKLPTKEKGRVKREKGGGGGGRYCFIASIFSMW